MNQDKTVRNEERRGVKYQGFVKGLFWGFALFLVLMNVIPLGKADASLSSRKISFLRLDYIVHGVIMLGFAWIYLLAKCLKIQFFASKEKPNMILLIFLFAVLLEPLQLLVPWRTFNPLDFYANLVGAVLASIFVLIVR